MLVGREKELHLLHDIQNDDSLHFVAVYGRRRVGKTFLIREAFGYRFAFQHAGLSEGGMKEQIYAFTSSLKDAGYEVKKQPQNWPDGMHEKCQDYCERRKWKNSWCI